MSTRSYVEPFEILKFLKLRCEKVAVYKVTSLVDGLPSPVRSFSIYIIPILKFSFLYYLDKWLSIVDKLLISMASSYFFHLQY